jgi:two-component system osmolarity sensor histidine kinase EnvZ
MSRWLPRSILGRTVLLVALALLTLALSYLVVMRGLLLSESSQYVAELAALRYERALARLPTPSASVTLAQEPPAERPPSKLFQRGLIFERYEAELRRHLGPEVEIRLDAAGERLWLKTPASRGVWVGLPAAFPLPRFARRALVAAGLALLATVALATLFASHMTRPLVQLATWAKQGGDDPVPSVQSAAAPREAQELAAALASFQAQLRATEREREIMLAGISHDLRTPLTRVRLRVEMLDKPAEHAAELERDFDELDAVVEQFIAYARGADAEPQAELALDALARDVAGARAGVALELSAPTPIALRRSAAERSVRNLLDNAAQYGAPPVIVRTFNDRSEAVVAVRDHGSGIAAGDRTRALAPFARLRGAGGVAGAGLGLAIVQRLMESDGGRVEFADGGGTYFEVQLRWPA